MSKYFFIGIGGIGMSALAIILKQQGHEVEGSDASKSYITDILEKCKINVYLGHDEKNIKNHDYVIYTSAVNNTNVEFRKSIQNNIKMLKRGELLAQIAKDYQTIAIAGSHGKTTTTSMISTIFNFCEDSSFYIGGISKNLGTHASLNKGQCFITESDESDGSFLNLNPAISIINNIDNDHLDYYKNIDNLKNSFIQFSNQSKMVLANIDDKNVAEIFDKIQTRKYSISRNKADFIYERDKDDLIINWDNKLYKFKTSILGDYNITNLAVSISVALLCGFTETNIQKSINQYSGVGRRLDLIYQNEFVKVYDDYAHHPTEIYNVLSSLKKISKNVIAVWEPHRISRVEHLKNDFIKALDLADKVYITDIYTASEENPKNINTESLIKEINNKKYEKFINFDFVKSVKEVNSIVVTLNAGKLNSIVKKYFNENT